MAEPETIGGALRGPDAILAWWSRHGERDLVSMIPPDEPIDDDLLVPVLIVRGAIFQLARNHELELYVAPPVDREGLERWLSE